MADGIFTIKPRWLSDVVCTMGGSTTVKFSVLSSTIDWNEAERVKVAYASGGVGGSASGEQRGLVGCKWDMVIFGTDQADAMSGLRTMSQALTNPDGGQIQYRPRGLDAGVMSTYYHYLQSSPPQIMSQGALSDYANLIGQAGRSGHDFVIRCRCSVITEAWATSDPETLVTIVSETNMQNRDDTTHDNHLTVENASIKGDALIPVLKVTGGIGAAWNSLLVHKRRMIDGSNTNLDWLEAEDDMGEGFVNHADTDASDGNVAQCTGVQGYLNPDMTSMDSTYLGKVTAIICVKVDSGTTFDVDVYVANSGIVLHSVTKTIVGDGNWHLYFLTGYSIPPGEVQKRYDDTTAITIGGWSQTSFTGKFDRTVGSGNCEVDFWVFAKEDEFLGTFSETQVGISTTFITLYIDAYSEMAWGDHSLSDKWHTPWANGGPHYSGLYMHKGFDYRLRFLGYIETDTAIDQTDLINVTVYGLYATIFPFEES